MENFSTTNISLHSLDVESKALIPTVKLYEQIVLHLQALFSQFKAMLTAFYNNMLIASKQFNADPVETTQRWYAETETKVKELYFEFNNTLIPTAKDSLENIRVQLDTFFQNSKILIADMGEKMQTAWQNFYAEPVSVMNSMYQQMLGLFSKTWEISKPVILQIQEMTSNVVMQLVDQPLLTIKTFSLNILSALLDLYSDTVLSILVLI